MSNDSSIFLVSPEISSVMGVMDAHLKWKSANGKPRGYETYHPSAFGACLRNMQYFRYVEKGYIQISVEEFDSKTIRIFDTGHTMHSRWASYSEDIGILRGYWICTNPMCRIIDDEGKLIKNISNDIISSQTEKPRMYGKKDPLGCFKPEKCICGNNVFEYREIDVSSKELNFYGHADMVWDFSKFNPEKYNGFKKGFNMELLPKNPVVVDMKTINDYGYKKVLQSGPDLKYKIQLTIYANLLPVEYGLLIYENKNSSEVAPYKIDKSTDNIFAQIKKQAISMNEMVPLKLLPPPRPLDQDDIECRKCPFAQVCHKSKIWSDKDLVQKRKSFYGNLMK
jgi:hypothetical protein